MHAFAYMRPQTLIVGCFKILSKTNSCFPVVHGFYYGVVLFGLVLLKFVKQPTLRIGFEVSCMIS